MQRGLTPAKGQLDSQLDHSSSRTVRLCAASEFFREGEIVIVSLVRSPPRCPSGRGGGSAASGGAEERAAELPAASARTELRSAVNASNGQAEDEEHYPKVESAKGEMREVEEEGGRERYWPLGDAGWVRRLVSRARSRLIVVGNAAIVRAAEDEDGSRPWEHVLSGMTVVHCDGSS